MSLYKLYIFCLNAIFQIAGLFHFKVKKRLQLLSTNDLKIKTKQKVIWVHAASAGEFEQAIPLIEQLKKQHPYFISVSFFSASGFEMYQHHTLIDHVWMLPFDNSDDAKRIVSNIRPSAVIWIKYEFWYFFLKTIHDAKIPLVFINTDIQKLLKNKGLYGKVIRRCLRFFDVIYSNTPFESIDLPIKIQQNTGIQRAADISKLDWKNDFFENWVSGKKIFIAGSVYLKDIEILKSVFPALLEEKYKIVLVPHETDEPLLKNIQNLLSEYKISFWNEKAETQMMIVQEKGILKYLYRHASFAYIGGGFNQGIHNFLEASAYHIPVFCGPKHKNYPEISFFREHQLVFQATKPSEISIALKKAIALSNDVSFKEKSNQAWQYLLSQNGTAEMASTITTLIKKNAGEQQP